MKKWRNNRGRGLEWIHHKIYLASDVPRVNDFSISDGFNMLFYNWVRPFPLLSAPSYYRLGLGLVFAHMDVSIEGRETFYMKGGIQGSYLAGVAAQLSVDKWIKTFKRHFISVETKFTAAYCRGPVSSNILEYSVIPNYAFHVVLGAGTRPHTHQNAKDTFKTMALPSLGTMATGFTIKTIDQL